jgi:FixJ family two-component response regulator
MEPEESLGKKICLIDDDASVLKAIGRLLASAGWIVQAFSEAAPFLAYVSTNRVDLVILDIWMKQMSGLAVLAHLCALSPRTRVIIITGRDDSAVKSIASQIGAAAFFLKPFDDEEFLAAVHHALATCDRTKTKVP